MAQLFVMSLLRHSNELTNVFYDSISIVSDGYDVSNPLHNKSNENAIEHHTLDVNNSLFHTHFLKHLSLDDIMSNEFTSKPRCIERRLTYLDRSNGNFRTLPEFIAMMTDQPPDLIDDSDPIEPELASLSRTMAQHAALIRFELCCSEFEKITGATISMLVDTGATISVLRENLVHLLFNLRDPQTQLQAYDGHTNSTMCEGQLGHHISRCLVSRTTLYNILSASQLMGPGKPFRGEIDGHQLRIIERTTGEILVVALHIRGLWFLDLDKLLYGFNLTLPEGEDYTNYPDGDTISKFATDADMVSYANALPLSQVLMQHLSTGHMNFKLLWTSYKNGLFKIKGPPLTRELFLQAAQMCSICAQAKGTKRVPKKSERVAEYLFQMLSLDICEVNCTSWKGFNYFALMVDKWSNNYYVFFLKRKSDLLRELRNWFRSHFRRDKKLLQDFEVKILEKWQQRGIEWFRTDGGGEMQSHAFTDLLAEYFVKEKQTSVPYSHADNALAERAINRVCVSRSKISKLCKNLSPRSPTLIHSSVLKTVE